MPRGGARLPIKQPRPRAEGDGKASAQRHPSPSAAAGPLGQAAPPSPPLPLGSHCFCRPLQALLRAAPHTPPPPLLSYIPESPGQPPCYLWKLTAHPLLLNHRWVWFSSDSVSSDQSRHLWDKQTRQQYLLSTYCMLARSQAEKQSSDYDQEASPPEGTRCSLLKHTGSERAAKLPSHTHPHLPSSLLG